MMTSFQTEFHASKGSSNLLLFVHVDVDDFLDNRTRDNNQSLIRRPSNFGPDRTAHREFPSRIYSTAQSAIQMPFLVIAGGKR